MQDLTKLPLHEVLLANGYKLDRVKSSKMYPCLVNVDNNERLIVSKKGENYLYFNQNDETDRGNILSFVRIRGLDIKELVANYDTNITLANEYKHQFFTHKQDSYQIIKAYKALSNITQEDIAQIPLFKQKGFDIEYLKPLQHTFKKDEHNNIVIPNFKLSSDDKNYNPKIMFICGYTKRLNYPITKDKQGVELTRPLKSLQYGNKSLEILSGNKNPALIKNIIISENIIDSLSLGQMKNIPPQECVFISTAGNFNIKTLEESMLYILDKAPNARITLAFDNDTKGQSYTQEMEKNILTHTKKLPYIYKPFSKDCNDDLKIRNITDLKTLNQETYQGWAEAKILKYRVSNDTNTRALILHHLRKLHSLKPLNEANRNLFNTIKKHASIKLL